MKLAAKSGGSLLKANLTEIMESVQGEGLLIGSRQVFLRFSGCNLRCHYCDTPNSLEASPNCRISYNTGCDDNWQMMPNPLSVQQISTLLDHYQSNWVSLTGGEPLIWADFIKELGISIKPQKYRFLLETNGILYEQLDVCLPFIDMISMDFKLPSATGEDNWFNHEKFFKRAVNKPIYIKVIVDNNTKESEIIQAAAIIAAIRPGTPMILQPVTPIQNLVPPTVDILLKLQQICLEYIRDVRIIPQIHKYMGLI